MGSNVRISLRLLSSVSASVSEQDLVQAREVIALLAFSGEWQYKRSRESNVDAVHKLARPEPSCGNTGNSSTQQHCCDRRRLEHPH